MSVHFLINRFVYVIHIKIFFCSKNIQICALVIVSFNCGLLGNRTLRWLQVGDCWPSAFSCYSWEMWFQSEGPEDFSCGSTCLGRRVKCVGKGFELDSSEMQEPILLNQVTFVICFLFCSLTGIFIFEGFFSLYCQVHSLNLLLWICTLLFWFL